MKKMTKRQLKNSIQEWNRLMTTYPEDENLRYACEIRIAEAEQELRKMERKK